MSQNIMSQNIALKLIDWVPTVQTRIAYRILNQQQLALDLNSSARRSARAQSAATEQQSDDGQAKVPSPTDNQALSQANSHHPDSEQALVDAQSCGGSDSISEEGCTLNKPGVNEVQALTNTQQPDLSWVKAMRNTPSEILAIIFFYKMKFHALDHAGCLPALLLAFDPIKETKFYKAAETAYLDMKGQSIVLTDVNFEKFKALKGKDYSNIKHVTFRPIESYYPSSDGPGVYYDSGLMIPNMSLQGHKSTGLNKFQTITMDLSEFKDKSGLPSWDRSNAHRLLLLLSLASICENLTINVIVLTFHIHSSWDDKDIINVNHHADFGVGIVTDHWERVTAGKVAIFTWQKNSREWKDRLQSSPIERDYARSDPSWSSKSWITTSD